MARRSRPTSQKRNKEMARQQKQKDKATRRLEAKERKTNVESQVSGKDLDIAGIQPGPQPLPEQWDYSGSAD
jgi:hypothetical protein